MTIEHETPNEILAEIVADALVGAGLVSPGTIEELKRKLAAGTAKAEDWSQWIKSAQRDPHRDVQRKE